MQSPADEASTWAEHRRLSVGLSWGARPPLSPAVQMTRLARFFRLDFMFLYDHVQGQFPRSIWDQRLGYWCDPATSPHEDFEAFTALGRLSAVAGGLQLGVGVTDILRRHPIVLAQAALTLSHLTKRPFILGLGAGERMNTEPYGLDPVPRADRLEEAARFIRAAFDSSGPFDIEGRYFRADGAVLDLPSPPGRRPRLWVAAHGPRALAACGRVGDGWYPLIKDAVDYEQGLGAVRAAAAEASRNPDEVVPAGHLDLLVAPSGREVRELLDSRIARWAAVFGSPAAAWRELGVRHPFGDDFGGYRDMLVEALDPGLIEEAIEAVPRELVERRFLWGTPDLVLRKLEALVDAGLRAVTFMPISIHTRRLTLQTIWTMGRIAARFR